MKGIIATLMVFTFVIASPSLAADVALQWDKSIDHATIKEYRVYTRRLPDPWPKAGVSAGLETTYIHRGVTSGSYEYAVSAFSEQYGEGGKSNVVANKVPPDAPKNLRIIVTVEVVQP